MEKGKEKALAPLPLYHIFSFLVNGFVFFLNGFTNVLIVNPRQIQSIIKTLKKQNVTIGTGIKTLFKGLLAQKNFKELDFSKWKIFISGGMALKSSVQKQWRALTQSRLSAGYGLTESPPIVCVERLNKEAQENCVGYPLKSELKMKKEKN